VALSELLLVKPGRVTLSELPLVEARENGAIRARACGSPREWRYRNSRFWKPERVALSELPLVEARENGAIQAPACGSRETPLLPCFLDARVRPRLGRAERNILKKKNYLAKSLKTNGKKG
jgi:hypothetical protein